MSMKLTNYMRERIAKEILKHRFAESAEELRTDRAAFAEDVYNDVYRKTDREKMAALPEGWLPAETEISAQFGGQRGYESLSFSGAFYGALSGAHKEKWESVSRRVLYRHHRSCTKVYEPEHRLSLRYQELAARKDTLDQQYRDAERQVKVALDGASTANRLIDMWPEVAPFVRQFEAAPAKVPSIAKDQLNKLLDLPVAEAA